MVYSGSVNSLLTHERLFGTLLVWSRLPGSRPQLPSYRNASEGSAPADEIRRLRAAIDSLEATFCAKARSFQLSGGHLAEGATSVVAWIRNNCNMSGASAADRVCVGKELESLPLIAEALASGRDRLSVRRRAVPPARAAG